MTRPKALFVPSTFPLVQIAVPAASVTSPVNVLLGLLNVSVPMPVFVKPAVPAISTFRVAFVFAAKTGEPVSASGPPDKVYVPLVVAALKVSPPIVTPPASTVTVPADPPAPKAAVSPLALFHVAWTSPAPTQFADVVFHVPEPSAAAPVVLVLHVYVSANTFPV